MTLHHEFEPEQFRPWHGEPINGVSHPTDIAVLWSDEELAAIDLYKPAPADAVPEGTMVAATSVQRVVGVVRYVNELVAAPVQRRMVPKSLVQSRLIADGLMGEAHAALMANPILFARWFASDQPNVYADDSDALAFLIALGADVETVMAEAV